MRESKVPCEVHGLGGVAHVLEYVYDQHVTFWAAAVQVDTQLRQAQALAGLDVTLTLGDGRRGTARCLGVGWSDVNSPKTGEVGRAVIVYLSGTSALAVSGPLPAA
jgi:hypothetical protein